MIISEQKQFISYFFIGVIDATSIEQIVGKPPESLNMIFSEEDIGQIVQVDLMQFSMPDKGRDDVEHELSGVDIHDDGWDSMERAILDDL